MISYYAKAHVIMLHDISLLSKDELVEIVNEAESYPAPPRKTGKRRI